MCGVYYLFDGADVLYIGSSLDIGSRISAHRRNIDFAGYFVDECRPEQLIELEVKAIQEFKPLLNECYVSD